MGRKKYFEQCKFKSAFEQKNKGKHQLYKYKREEKKRNEIAKDTKKEHHTELSVKFIATGSSFKSDSEIIASLFKKEEPICEVKIIDHSGIKIEEASRAQKAMTLARKYKKHHYLMKIMSKKNHKYLSEKQIDLIFNLAKQIKDEINFKKFNE